MEATLRLIPVKAFDRYHDRQRDERAVFRPRVQADIIHAYMEAEARGLLRTVWNVVLSPPSMQAFFFDVEGRWRFRLHKLNDDFTIENNRTVLALEFIEQRGPQIALGLGHAEPTNLHLGYRLNPVRTGLASVHIVCPTSEQEIAWQYILPAPDVGPQPAQPVRPVRPDGPRLRPGETPAEAPRRADESGAA